MFEIISNNLVSQFAEYDLNCFVNHLITLEKRRYQEWLKEWLLSPRIMKNLQPFNFHFHSQFLLWSYRWFFKTLTVPTVICNISHVNKRYDLVVMIIVFIEKNNLMPSWYEVHAMSLMAWGSTAVWRRETAEIRQTFSSFLSRKHKMWRFSISLIC